MGHFPNGMWPIRVLAVWCSPGSWGWASPRWVRSWRLGSGCHGGIWTAGLNSAQAVRSPGCFESAAKRHFACWNWKPCGWGSRKGRPWFHWGAGRSSHPVPFSSSPTLKCVVLQARWATIAARLEGSERPLLGEARTRFEARREHYRSVGQSVATDGLSPVQVTDRVVELVRRWQ